VELLLHVLHRLLELLLVVIGRGELRLQHGEVVLIFVDLGIGCFELVAEMAVDGIGCCELVVEVAVDGLELVAGALLVRLRARGEFVPLNDQTVHLLHERLLTGRGGAQLELELGDLLLILLPVLQLLRARDRGAAESCGGARTQGNGVRRKEVDPRTLPSERAPSRAIRGLKLGGRPSGGAL
jgi:hypothetical protein